MSMIVRTENLLMTLACFLAACCDGHSSLTFGDSQFARHQGGFIAPLPTGI